jgi:hypothetical protein
MYSIFSDYQSDLQLGGVVVAYQQLVDEMT